MSHAGSISRRPETCCVTGERFVPDEPIVAALVEGEPDADPIRADTRLSVWKAGSRPQGVLLGWWQTTARVTAEPEDAVEITDLIEFVLQDPEQDPEDRADAGSMTRQAVRYLVALELVRRRKLVLHPSKDTSVRVQVPFTAVQRAAGEVEPDPVSVPAPDLDRAELSKVAEMLGSLVGVGD